MFACVNTNKDKHHIIVHFAFWLLESICLETNPGRWIKSAWELRSRRAVVAERMRELYTAAPKDTWDLASVPGDCNAQALFATQAYIGMCARKG